VDGAVPGSGLHKRPESGTKATEPAWDEARRERASRIYSNFIMNTTSKTRLLNPVDRMEISSKITK
jgi:hypothetical protein